MVLCVTITPVLYSDPSGKSVILTCIIIGALLGLTAGVTYGAIKADQNGLTTKDGWDYWRYPVGYGAIGATGGAIIGWGAGLIIACFGVAGTATASTIAAQQTIQKDTPIIGDKLNYLFGQATGPIHNLQRSTDMLNQLGRIGIHDTADWREFMFQTFWRAYYFITPTIQENGKGVREFFLIGPDGMLKVQTIWEGTKLLTFELFGKADSWFSR